MAAEYQGSASLHSSRLTWAANVRALSNRRHRRIACAKRRLGHRAIDRITPFATYTRDKGNAPAGCWGIPLVCEELLFTYLLQMTRALFVPLPLALYVTVQPVKVELGTVDTKLMFEAVVVAPPPNGTVPVGQRTDTVARVAAVPLTNCTSAVEKVPVAPGARQRRTKPSAASECRGRSCLRWRTRADRSWRSAIADPVPASPRSSHTTGIRSPQASAASRGSPGTSSPHRTRRGARHRSSDSPDQPVAPHPNPTAARWRPHSVQFS